jgi:hypothetical protein
MVKVLLRLQTGVPPSHRTSKEYRCARRIKRTAPNNFVHSEFCCSFVHASNTSQRATAVCNEQLTS